MSRAGMRRMAPGSSDDPGATSGQQQRRPSSFEGIHKDHPSSVYQVKPGKMIPKVTYEGRTSTRQSILNLVNCILGAGVLGYPYCFKSCGLLLASLIMIVSLAACRFSYQLLLYCSHLSSKRTYEELAQQAVGRIGKQIVELCTAALNLGAIVAYLNILADVLSSVAGTIIPPGAEPSRSVYLAGVTVFGAFPMAMIVRDHQVVAAFSTASVGFIILFALVILIFALSPVQNLASASMGVVQLWRPDGLLVAFPVMAYGFTAHPYYLGIYSNMQTASIRRMTRVTDVAVGLSAALYWLVGMSGYLTFKSRTAGDLLRNFGAAHVMGLRGAYERAIKLCYGLAILGSVPLVIMPFYNLILPLLGYETVHIDPHRKFRLSDSDDDSAVMPAAADKHTSHTSSGSGVVHLHHVEGARFHTNNGDSSVSSPMAHGHSGHVDVVDLKLQHDGIHYLSGGVEELAVNPMQHAIVAIVVLGLGMASAIWVPNVEFIFGLTGATASTLLAYILPAITFIRLLDSSPELTSNMGGKASTMSSETQMRNEWVWRRRKAVVLLVFGIVSGITCTDAILGAVKEEAAVVQLAQRLVAHEAVVAETTRAQQKAKEAVAAVSMVTTASKQLDAAQANATNTLGKLQEAAQALSTITKAPAKPKHSSWDLNEVLKEHKQHVTESKVLKNVEATLQRVRSEVGKTFDAVHGVVGQLDVTISQLKEEAGKAANASAQAKSSSGNRVSDLATELGKALGMYNDVAQNVTAGKSLEQVRANAAMALLALNQTLHILDNVTLAVEAAKRDHKHDEQIKDVAAHAMEMALNATATSALAMRMTHEALQKSANEETDELLSMLTKVANDLTHARTKKVKVERVIEGPQDKGDKGDNAAATGSTSSTSAEAARSDTTGAAGSGVGSGPGTERAAGQAASGAKQSQQQQQNGSSKDAPDASAGVEGSASAKTLFPSPSTSGASAASSSSSGKDKVIQDRKSAAGSGSTQQQEGKAGSSTTTTTSSTSSGSSGLAATAGSTQQGTGSAGGGANGTDTAVSKSAMVKERVEVLKKVIQDLHALTNATASGGTTVVATAAGASSTSVATGTSSSTASAGVGISSSTGSTGSSGSSGSSAATGAGATGSAASGGSGQGHTSTTTSSGTSSTTTSSTSSGSSQSTRAASGIRAGSSTGAGTGSTTAGSSSTTGATSTSNIAGEGSGSSVSSGDVREDDLDAVKDVLKDAVAWTQGSQAAVMKDIQDSLGKANSKVQERVVSIVRDMSETKKDATAKKEGASTTVTGVEAGAATAASASTITTANAQAAAALGRAGGVKDSGLTLATVGAAKLLEKKQAASDAAQVTDHGAFEAGPVVKVNAAGQLEQQDGDSTVQGPVVTEQQQQQRQAPAGTQGSSQEGSSTAGHGLSKMGLSLQGHEGEQYVQRPHQQADKKSDGSEQAYVAGATESATESEPMSGKVGAVG